MRNNTTSSSREEQVMISQLSHTSALEAQEIFHVFQKSYKVEADLVGVSNFPPLSRTVDNIQQSNTLFFGFYCQEQLAAVIEISNENSKLHINSLTVLPTFFRQGIASKLINHVLQSYQFIRATVETAVVNEPAIALYERHGFVEYKQYTPSHGIPKVAMALTK